VQNNRARPAQFGPAFPSVLEAAQAGAGWSFTRLFHAYGPAVAGYLRVQRVADPDGLANEVFLRVFRGISRFEGTEEKFRSWVFTIAHHVLVDEVRRCARRPMEHDDGDAIIAAERGGNAEDEAIDHMADGDVRELLRGLARDQRDVLLLRVVGDLTVEQVAETLGKSPGAVKQLQRRGLEALRRKISSGTPVPF
jgi:RNA polymerase sigma-70 factor (ECF subfamily)